MPLIPVSAPRHDPLGDTPDSPSDHPELLRPARPSKPRASSPLPQEDGITTETGYASLDDLLRALLAEPRLRPLLERLMGARR